MKRILLATLFVVVAFYGKAQLSSFYWGAACYPDTINFHADSISANITHEWDFAGQGTSSMSEPMFAFADTGNYNVMHVAHDTALSQIDTTWHMISYFACGPTGNSFNWNYTCFNDSTEFQPNVGDPAANVYVEWYFGDGNTLVDSTQGWVYHAYADTGNYQVMMIAKDTANMLDTVVNWIYINDCPAPQNDFWWGTTCSGDSTDFYSSFADGFNVQTSYWTFGDGDTSFLANPKHLYADTGMYSVQLYITDTLGNEDTVMHSVHIMECVGNKLSDFNWSNGCVNDTAFFWPMGNTGEIASYQWTFGDGDSAFVSNPNHLFADTGNYMVTLITTDTTGWNDTTTNFVWIGECAPPPSLSDFGWGNTCVADSVPFWPNGNLGEISTYQWTFGNGDTSYVSHPTILYADTGSYNVQLVIMDTAGVYDTTNHMIYIQECAGVKLSDFNWSNGCVNDTAFFWPLGNMVEIASFLWTFGDGDSAFVSNPNHLYADTGNYMVTLITTDTTGWNDTTSNFIYVGSCPQNGNTFTWNYTCLNDSTEFQPNVGDPAANLYVEWNFGDGNTLVDSTQGWVYNVYSDTGNYQVQMIVKDTANMMDTTYSWLYINNCGGSMNDFYEDFTCLYDTTQFTPQLVDPGAVTNIVWNFGDGSPQDTINGVVYHAYADTGYYMVTMFVFDTLGTDTVYRNVYINDCGGNTYLAYSSECLEDSIVFSIENADLSNIEFYTWTMGDGTTYTTQTATHKYNSTGVYEVKIVAQTFADSLGNYYTDSLLATLNIIVCDTVCNMATLATTTLASDSVTCDGSATLNTSGGATPYTYNWSNASSGTVDSTLCAGNYSVTIIDNVGCEEVYNFSIGVDTTQAPCTVSTVATTTLASDSVTCDGSATLNTSGGATPYTYNWSNASTGTVDSTLCAGNYSVTISDNVGCEEVYNFSVGVDTTQIPCNVSLSIASSNNVSCFGAGDGTASVQASGGTAPYVYSWSNGKVGKNQSGLIAKTYGVTVTDINGCKAINSVVITQPTKLVVNSTSTNANCGQPDGEVSVTVTGGVAPYAYSWLDGSSDNTLTGITSGGYGVTATDSVGCSASVYAMVGDNDGPAVTIVTVVDANCGGNDGAIFTSVSGGQQPYSHLWSNGVVAPNLLNAEAGTNTVVVTDNNGCSGTATATVGTNGVEPPSISGHVTTQNSGFIVTSGTVNILIPNPYGGAFLNVGSTTLDSNGYYSFDAIVPIGQYTIYVEPNNAIPAFGNTIATYNGLTNKWSEADIINTVCDSSFVQDIIVKELDSLNGSNNIGGTVVNDGSNRQYGSRAGDPIPGIDVSLEQIPGGIIAFTETDENGEFSFPSVPTSDSLYTIYVDIPGLPMKESYEIDLSETAGTDSTNTGYNFLVSDSTIYTDASTSVKEPVKVTNSSMEVYPNPFSDYTNIVYQLKKSSDVQVEVFNILGERLYNYQAKDVSKGGYSIQFQGGDVANRSGVYVVRTTIGSEVHTARILQVK